MVKKTDDIDMSNATRELVFSQSVSREFMSHNAFWAYDHIRGQGNVERVEELHR